MTPLMTAFFFGLGAAGFAYTKLVRANGNPSPYQDLGGAAIAGLVMFIFIFTLLKYVLDLK